MLWESCLSGQMPVQQLTLNPTLSPTVISTVKVAGHVNSVHSDIGNLPQVNVTKSMTSAKPGAKATETVRAVISDTV